jgi:ubiquinone/menaquinone biosynthesis C-methylase UbiE
VRKTLYRFYWALERTIVPGLRSSQHAYYDVVHSFVAPGAEWLDLGCGHQVFASWMTAEERELIGRARHVVGVDLDVVGMNKHQSIRDKAVGNLEQLPFASGSFGVVTANMVVEHLQNPAAVLREIRRVLRPQGLLIYHTPNSRCFAIRTAGLAPQWLKHLLIRLLEGRQEADVFKTFYRMNTPQNARRLASEAGFELEVLNLVNTSAITALLGPLAIAELAYLRLLTVDRFASARSNIIAVLRKPS